MRSSHFTTLLAALLATRALSLMSQPLAEVRRLLAEPSAAGCAVSCTGTVDFVITPDQWYFTITDGADAVVVNIHQDSIPLPVRPGDRIAVSGRIADADPSALFCTAAVRLGHDETPVPAAVSIGAILDGRFPYRHVRVRGLWEDVFIDEIDPRWIYGILSDGQDRLFVTIERRWTDFDAFARLVGATVEISGIARFEPKSGRRQFGYSLLTVGTNHLQVVAAPPADPFACPDLAALRNHRPDQIARLPRHRTCGRVLAVWDRENAVLRTPDGAVVGLRFATPPPAAGQTLEAAGLPETDFFNLNLVRAIWRPTAVDTPPEPPVEPLSVSTLATVENGNTRFKSAYHGRLVRVRGILRNRPAAASDSGRLILEDDEGHTLLVNASACPTATERLELGTTLAVTGVCVMETSSDRLNAIIPRIRDIQLVVRTPDDIAVLATPPWWTPTRLLWTLAALFALLVASFVWNRMLRNLAERRGRALADEHVARAESDLKTLERTRLAVELHDTLAQNLTGVAFEIDAATRLGATAPSEMTRHLATATRTLESCRSELRDCLWDLRSHALEESDMDAAIRQTLLPHVDGVTLALRFTVPRERLSENAAHGVLRIIRELVVNAIRHGGATRVQVAGTLDGPTLRFSVCDNGCGFDPENVPGVREGHFGLNGIRERLKSFGGNLSVERLSPVGMRLTATLNLL